MSSCVVHRSDLRILLSFNTVEINTSIKMQHNVSTYQSNNVPFYSRLITKFCLNYKSNHNNHMQPDAIAVADAVDVKCFCNTNYKPFIYFQHVCAFTGSRFELYLFIHLCVSCTVCNIFNT
eukprot:269334_1